MDGLGVSADAELMEAVFLHYGLRWPRGYGDVSICCPVHDDRHASASVNTSKGLFNCHACGAAGDAHNLVMAREGVEFVDAKRLVEEIARASGLNVSGDVRGQSGRGVHGRSGDRPERSRYVPSWIRK